MNEVIFFIISFSCVADKVEVQRTIRIMWADCGDATSVQYAGTPAMRSDFAKTGKRMRFLDV
jgi:hypothetical protein